MSPRISVVVPVYNVAAYLDTCLESLAQQTFADLEVVMVDDGSTDESLEIAERFAARDPRFRLVRQANAGLGAARNTGAAHASGEFIAFADSDDVVPRHAYELLLGALDETGSDFASGNVRRLTSTGTQRAGFLARAFERTRLQTHITRFPALLVDRTAWNKLFRRSFWDRHGLRFPTGVYYEDTPVTLPAHYLADSVDVIEQTVYLWRMREGPDLSITQRRTETKTLRDRVAAVDHVSRFLGEQGFKLSKAAYDRTVVGSDLRYFLDVLPSADVEYRRLFLELANDFIDRADDWALDQPFAIDRVKWELVRRRALPELLELLRFEDEQLGDVPPMRVGRRWYGDYPYRTDERLRIPSRAYRLGDELAPVFRLNDVRWDGDTLRIDGYAYIDLLGAPGPDSQSVELVARRHGLLSRRLRLATERVHRPDVTASSAQEVADLQWSGFTASLAVGRLERGGRIPQGSWEIGAVIRTDTVARTSWRPAVAALHTVPPVELTLGDGTHVRAGLDANGRLRVDVQQRRSLATSCDLEEGVLVIQGPVGFAAGRQARLHVSRRIGGVTLDYPVYVDRSKRTATFLARLPIGDLVRELDIADGAAEIEQHSEGLEWDLFLGGAGGRRPLLLDEAAAEPAWTFNGREIAVRRTPEGQLSVTEGRFRPIVTDVDWSPAGTLTVGGSFRGPDGEYDLVLSAESLESVSVPLSYDTVAGRFSAELTPAVTDSPAGVRPLGEGVWQVLVRPRAGSAREAVGTLVDSRLLRTLPRSAQNGLKRFHVGVEGDESAALIVERDLEGDERGGFVQRRFHESFYPAQRTRELVDAVVYDCFGGRAYSDSPRAIHEELVRRGAPFEHLWIVRDEAFAVPDSTVAVREGSREHYEALATSRYVVANDHWPRWFLRRPDQTCVQTWHGFPMKLQGHALADRPKALRAYRRVLDQKAENWQYVVSPGASATPILTRAFPIGAGVIESGLPRTDLLLGSDREQVAEDVRRRLGVAGKRVILYAPTYRDHLDYRPGRRPGQLRDLPAYSARGVRRDGYRLGPMLDTVAAGTALGDDDVLLFHRHRRILEAPPAGSEPFMRDVSVWPDLLELLLAADVLITDYSSAAYDFACTGRPLLFFTPDLEDYRDEIRGFSIDFESEAPGPLLRTTEEVVDALRDLEAVAAGCRERYERFVARHCALSDGEASSRVVEAVFHW